MSDSVRYCQRCSYLFLKFTLVLYATVFWVSFLSSVIFIAGHSFYYLLILYIIIYYCSNIPGERVVQVGMWISETSNSFTELWSNSLGLFNMLCRLPAMASVATPCVCVWVSHVSHVTCGCAGTTLISASPNIQGPF